MSLFLSGASLARLHFDRGNTFGASRPLPCVRSVCLTIPSQVFIAHPEALMVLTAGHLCLSKAWSLLGSVDH